MNNILTILFALVALVSVAAEPLQRYGSDRFRVPGNVYCLLVSSDNKYIAAETASLIIVFNATSGEKVFEIDVRTPEVRTESITLHNDILGMVEDLEDQSSLFSQYSLITGRLLKQYKITININPTNTYNQAFHGSLAAIGKRQSYSIVDLEHSKVINRLPYITFKNTYLKVSFSSDGRRLAACRCGERKSSIEVFDRRTAARILHTEMLDELRVTAFSADGLTLVAAGDAKLIVYNLTTTRAMMTIAHEGLPSAVAVTNGREVSCFDEDHRALLCFSDRGILKRRVDFTNEIGNATFSADARRFIYATLDGAVMIHDTATGRKLPQSAELSRNVSALCYLSDGRLAGFSDGWHTWPGHGRSSPLGLFFSQSPRFNLAGFDLRPSTHALSKDGATLATLHNDHIRVTRTTAGCEELHRFKLATPYDDATVAASSVWFDGADVLLHDSGRSEPLWRFSPTEPRRAVVLKEHYLGPCTTLPSPDGRRLLTLPGGDDGPPLLQLHDCRSGERLFSQPLPRGAVHAIFAPDASRIALIVSDEEGWRVQILDARSGFTLSSFSSTDSINALAFSPDARTLACSIGQEVLLIEAASGAVRGRISFTIGTGSPALAFAPHGRTLAISLQDGTVGIYDLAASFASSTTDATGLWRELGSFDAAVAYRAVRRMIARPAHTVASLKPMLPPANAVDATFVTIAVAKLDSSDYRERESATAALADVAERITIPLRKSQAEATTEESRERLDTLLRLAGPTSTRNLRATRAVEVVEALAADHADAVALLQSWAGGAGEMQLTRQAQAALARLAKQ